MYVQNRDLSVAVLRVFGRILRAELEEKSVFCVICDPLFHPCVLVEGFASWHNNIWL